MMIRFGPWREAETQFWRERFLKCQSLRYSRDNTQQGVSFAIYDAHHGRKQHGGKKLCKVIFRHELKSTCAQWGPHFLQSLPFTYEEHSRRFFGQMRTQQHKDLRRQDVTIRFHCGDRVFVLTGHPHSPSSLEAFESCLSKLTSLSMSSMCVWFLFFFTMRSLYSFYCFQFCICCMFETSSTIARSELGIQPTSCCVLTRAHVGIIQSFYQGAGRRNSEEGLRQLTQTFAFSLTTPGNNFRQLFRL